MLALSPALISGLVGCGACVRVGPPLSASGPSRRLAPKARLLPLVAESENPVLLPTALKLTFTVDPLAPVRMSGPLTLLFPDTIELTIVTVPAVVDVRAMPPPPVPEPVALAVLPAIVLF